MVVLLGIPEVNYNEHSLAEKLQCMFANQIHATSCQIPEYRITSSGHINTQPAPDETYTLN